MCAAPTGRRAACQAEVDLDVSGPLASPAAVPAGYGPADLQAAYALPSAASGAGRTVAIIDAYDDATAAQDLAAYRSKYGLPPCATGCFSKVNQAGASGPLPAADGNWAQETSLDLDMASAACPNCDILLVEAASSSLSDLGAAVDAAVALGAVAVSNSYGAAEFYAETGYDAHYDHPGVAVTVSAGDNGYGVEYPAASPYVTAVGGTTLTADATAPRSYTETAWGSSSGGAGTGSGCSAYEPKPAWQHDPGCAGRTVADVAAVADPATGVAVYDSTPSSSGVSGWLVFGGTSVGAPIIAAAYALAGAPAAGNAPAAFPYQTPGGLNDITSGADGSCIPRYLCAAAAGYDGPTGLGTPVGVAAFSAPASTGPPASPGAFGAVGPTRVLDTRNGTGAPRQAVPPGGSITVHVTGTAGVPTTGVAAVLLNVTVTQPTAAGYLTVYADGAARPLASNLNYSPGQTVPNLVLAPVGGDGDIRLYNGSAGTVQLIADLAGYYLTGPPASPGAFGAVGPTRVLDTRNGTGAPRQAVPPGGSITVHVTGTAGVPTTGVAAVLLNVTVTQPTAAGYLTVYADGAARPLASNLNYSPGQTVPNLVLAPVGGDGDIRLYNGSAGTVQLIADLAGYYLTEPPA